MAIRLGDTPEQQAAKLCAKSLNQCYCLLSSAAFDAQKMARACQTFALQYTGLSELALAMGVRRWGVKPKFHMMLHLCYSGNHPVQSWTYRDESFGGFIAKTCSRRGGKDTALAVGRSLLQRFAALHKLPKLGEKRALQLFAFFAIVVGEHMALLRTSAVRRLCLLCSVSLLLCSACWQLVYLLFFYIYIHTCIHVHTYPLYKKDLIFSLNI